MTSPTQRRPLPALAFLVALCLLAALVWWRVLERGTSSASAKATTCPTSPAGKPKHLPQPAAVTLAVLNSTQRRGIAAAARTALLADGFSIPEAATNDSAAAGGHGVIPGVAEIRYGPLATGAAQLVLYYLPGAKQVQTTAADATVTVALGMAYKAPATAAAAAAALKKDGITLVATTGVDTSGTNC